MTNPSDFFAGLDGDLSKPVSSRPRPEPQTFPCMSCGGDGKWHPTSRYLTRTNHRGDEHCFACGGRGYHAKPHAEAMRDKEQARAKREQGRANAMERRRADFDKANPGLREWMVAQTWSSFLQDMLGKIDTPYGLSERQLAAVLSTKAKSDIRQAERQAQRNAERAARTVEVSLATVETMFDKARASGLSKLAYRARGLVVSPAPAHGRNAGAIYVKTSGGEYLGKVAEGRFFATREATDEHKAALLAIAADPAGEAVRYGRETGSCCCCGRELTDPVSIKAGIGPICAEKWGF